MCALHRGSSVGFGSVRKGRIGSENIPYCLLLIDQGSVPHNLIPVHFKQELPRYPVTPLPHYPMTSTLPPFSIFNIQ